MAGASISVPVMLAYGPAGVRGILLIPVVFILLWAAIAGLAVLLTKPGVGLAEIYVAPTGASTPYEEQFSQEDALVMQGRVPDALASFEQRIADEPTNIAVRLRAAELYATLGKNPSRAAELFREAQRIPELTAGQDVYVGNRLADLYVGPLGLPNRALVELRRLLDRYPDSRVAPQLHQAITALKAHYVPDDRDP